MTTNCPRCGFTFGAEDMHRPDGAELHAGDIGSCGICGATLVFDPNILGDFRGLTLEEWTHLRMRQPDLHRQVIERAEEVLKTLLEQYGAAFARDLPEAVRMQDMPRKP